MQIKLVSRDRAEEMYANFSPRVLYELELDFDIWGNTYEVLHTGYTPLAWSNGIPQMEYAIDYRCERWFIPAWFVEEIYEDED